MFLPSILNNFKAISQSLDIHSYSKKIEINNGKFEGSSGTMCFFITLPKHNVDTKQKEGEYQWKDEKG
jgi:hypothetical protein